jgi:hypothetical protein
LIKKRDDILNKEDKKIEEENQEDIHNNDFIGFGNDNYKVDNEI